MATYKGNGGIVMAATDAVGELTGWTVTETAGTTEDTSQGDTARTYLPDGLPTWTAQVSGHYDADDTGQGALTMGAVLALEFDPIGTASGTVKLSGSGIVTQFQHGEVGLGVVIPFSAQFQGTGPLTRGANT